MENVDGMKLGKRENPEKNHKILTLPTAIVPLATPRFKLRTSVGIASDLTARTRDGYTVLSS